MIYLLLVEKSECTLSHLGQANEEGSLGEKRQKELEILSEQGHSSLQEGIRCPGPYKARSVTGPSHGPSHTEDIHSLRTLGG